MRTRFLSMMVVIALAFGGQPALGQVSSNQATMGAAQSALDAGNYARAAEIWRRQADLGNPEAMTNLGHLLYRGRGVERNPIAAVALFQRAIATPGYTSAWPYFRLAHAYWSGFGVGVNRVEANRLMQEAGRLGLPEAHYWRGLWSRSSGGQANDVATLRAFTDGALARHADSAYEAAIMILAGRGTRLQTGNVGEGMTYMGAAADWGNVRAIGFMAQDAARTYAMGGPKDAAIKWYRRANELGLMEDEKPYNVADLDRIVPVSDGYYLQARGQHQEAFARFSQLCRGNNIDACYEEAVYRGNGTHVPKDSQGAMALFERVCDARAPLGCAFFGSIVASYNGLIKGPRAIKAQNALIASCGTNRAARADCYSAALMSWDDRYGMRDSGKARTYSREACNRGLREGCRMVQAWQADDTWRAYVNTPSRPQRPSIAMGILAALVSAPIDSGPQTSAATRYGEASRQREQARSSYAISAMRRGSSNYGACPTVNSPGC